MKVTMNKVDESKLGVEYIASTIEDCDANGLMAIADDEAGIICIYDPKSNLYATSKSLMEVDASIDDIIKDEELKNEVMKPAIGDGFKEFSVKWNDLEKKGEDEEVYKTKKCAPIHGNFAESIDGESNPLVEEIMDLVFTYSDYYYEAIEGDGDESDMYTIEDEIRALLQDGSNGNVDFKSLNKIMDLVYKYAKVCYNSIEGDGDTTEQNRLSDLIQSKVEMVVSQD